MHVHISRLALFAPLAWASTLPRSNGEADFQCDLPAPIDPSGDGLPSARSLFSSEEALLKQVDRHGALVKVPSVCYDDLGPFDEDPRWAPFYDFHDVLAETFPLIHQHFEHEKINTFGLLYTLPGSDPSLKPLMLTAHQDVVPVADASTWTHPPFDAVYDGTWLWGRGASDDKNSLTALLSAVEGLLAGGWAPRRTVLLAFGFDEECSGAKGAGAIAAHLKATWGPDSLAIVLDEGGMGLLQVDDVLYALPAVMEKGHVDVWLTLHVQGGHSSTPFPHTGIGIAAELVTALEAHPYAPQLIKDSPIYNHYVCRARYSPDAEPEVTRWLAEGDLAAVAQHLARQDRATHYRLQTSQAVDLVAGGQKINAMPEKITLGVNYRVAPQNSVAEVLHNVVRHVAPVVRKYGLQVKAFERDDEYASYEGAVDHHHQQQQQEEEEENGGVAPYYDVDYNGTLVLSATQKTLPAPVSPSVGDAVWDVLSGTIQHSFAFEGGKVVPVGELMTGNTDTRHYLDLTRNVYRWSPTRQGGTAGMHTIDEKVNMTVHLELVRFYYDFVRNFDAADVAKTAAAALGGDESEEEL